MLSYIKIYYDLCDNHSDITEMTQNDRMSTNPIDQSFFCKITKTKSVSHTQISGSWMSHSMMPFKQLQVNAQREREKKREQSKC